MKNNLRWVVFRRIFCPVLSFSDISGPNAYFMTISVVLYFRWFSVVFGRELLTSLHCFIIMDMQEISPKTIQHTSTFLSLHYPQSLSAKQIRAPILSAGGCVSFYSSADSRSTASSQERGDEINNAMHLQQDKQSNGPGVQRINNQIKNFFSGSLLYTIKLQGQIERFFLKYENKVLIKSCKIVIILPEQRSIMRIKYCYYEKKAVVL